MSKKTTLKILDKLNTDIDFNNTIKIEDDVNKLEKNFDIILDTGNYLTNKNIIMNKNLKILFTWAMIDWIQQEIGEELVIVIMKI